MRPLITLVVLCTAFFITINAAPVLPSGYELETLRERDAQAGSELEQASVNVVSSLLSAASKKADQNDDLQQSLFNGFNSVLSSLGKQLSNEGGEIQSMMQARLDTPLMKSSEVHVQSGSSNQNLINAVRALFSALKKKLDPKGEVPQTILDGIDSVLSAVEKQLDEGQVSLGDNELTQTILDAVDNTFSALGRNTDPNDEMTQTFISAFRILFPLIIKTENGNNGDEFIRTFINVMKTIVSADHRNFNNEFAQAVLDAADIVLSFAAKGNRENQPPDEEYFKKIIRLLINNIIPAWGKGADKGRIKSPNGAGEAKTPRWGDILGSLATGVLNKYLSG